MSARPHRDGFTLVEMLVVITIVGVLASILLPAVQNARETARSAQCRSRLSNLQKAATAYEGAMKRLPGYQEEATKPFSFAPSVQPPGPQVRARKVSWAVVLLPYLEQGPLWDEWNEVDANQGQPSPTPPIPFDPVLAGPAAGLAPHLPIYVCPSDMRLDDQPALSYVGNAGLAYRIEQTLRQQNRADGVMFDLYDDAPFAPNQDLDNRRIRLSSDSIRDGAGYTLLFSEMRHETKFSPSDEPLGLYYAIQDIDNSYPGGGVLAPKHYTVFVYQDNLNNFDPRWRINANRFNPPTSRPAQREQVENDPLDDHNVRPSSNHINGVNVAFVGGVVRFLNQNIDYRAYQQMMASEDEEATLSILQSYPPFNPGDLEL